MDNYEVLNLSVSEARDLLRQWRESNERKSEEVLDIWTTILINGDIDKLDNEKYIIIEQVLIAGLDCHYFAVVDDCIYMLSKAFPGSMRVLKHKAAKLEALERYDEALEILDTIIKNDETNAAARKRRVAVFKAQGLITEAIKELVDYLKKFMSDGEGWQELCELYLQAQDYNKALFCAEELLLHHPHSHLVHQKLADIHYTMGGIENWELAKSYYAHALKLNPQNMRALLGLLLVTNNLLSQYKSSGTASKRKDVWKLNQWAQQKVSQRYRESGTTGPLPQQTDVPALDTMLLAMSINE